MQFACAILPSVSCPAVPYFPHYLKTARHSKKKVFEHKMCFDFIYKCFLKISHSKKMGRDMIITVCWSDVQYRLCRVPVMYSTGYVQYRVCTVPVMYSTGYVQYRLCTVPVM